MTPRTSPGRARGALGSLLVATLALVGCSEAERADPGGASSRSQPATATTRSPDSPTAADETSTGSPGPTRELTETEQRRLDLRLIDAAWDDDVARARRLIAAGADVNAKDETQQSAYLIATSEGYLDLLGLTFRNGADVRSLDSFDGTGLIRAAERGHADVVGRLLQTRIAVDHVNNLGWTALHEAIILGDGSRRYADTVRLLVAAGADLRIAPERDGIAPVRHAAGRGYHAIATTLRRALRHDSPADPDAALLRAASVGRPDLAARALRAGADLETRDGSRRTPLLRAVTDDRLAVARLLVHLGADPDALDGQHDTPWLVTGVTGSVQMAEVLLPARPDLTVLNRFGGTSLIPASERGHVTYVRRVVRTGIDLDHVNDLGWTAMLEAVVLGNGSRPYQRIVRTLLAAGADPTIADEDGVTPLEHARDRGQDRVARILARAQGGG